MSMAERKKKLNQKIVGWVNYFKLADMKKLMERTDEWTRRRIRMITWKNWKRVRTRYKWLRKLGVNHWKALEWANTRKGYWRIAGSKILSQTLTNKLFKRAKFKSFLEHYLSVRLSKLLEPPYTEPYVRWCERSANQLMASLLLDSLKHTNGQ